MTDSVVTEMVSELLDGLWHSLRNDASAERMSYVQGAIDMAGELGALTDEQVELWNHRIAKCPGHDDEGGRDWCAYCGNRTNGYVESQVVGSRPSRTTSSSQENPPR